MKRFLISVALLAVSWIAGSVCACADSVYTNETDFLTAIGASQSFLNEFSDLTESEQFVHPINYSSNGIAYSITSLPPLYLLSITGAVSTVAPTDDILVMFTSGNVRAAGGWLYLVDSNAAPLPGSLSVTFSNGGPLILTASVGGPSPLPFTGFVSSGSLITSLTIHSATSGAYPALDHFYAAEGAPEMSVSRSQGGALTIAWPAPGTGYALQSNPQLTINHWTNVPAKPQQAGDQMEVQLPAASGQFFYRLRKQ
jgi:hypothetical protein